MPCGRWPGAAQLGELQAWVGKLLEMPPVLVGDARGAGGRAGLDKRMHEAVIDLQVPFAHREQRLDLVERARRLAAIGDV